MNEAIKLQSITAQKNKSKVTSLRNDFENSYLEWGKSPSSTKKMKDSFPDNVIILPNLNDRIGELIMEEYKKHKTTDESIKRINLLFYFLQTVIIAVEFLLILQPISLFSDSKISKFELILFISITVFFGILLFFYIKESKEKVVETWQKR